MSDEKKFGKEELGDLARFGSDLLKKTVHSGLDALHDLKGNIPKDAANFIAKSKDEIIKGLSKEVLQSVVNGAVDTLFSVIRQHRIELSISIRKNDEPRRPTVNFVREGPAAPQPAPKRTRKK